MIWFLKSFWSWLDMVLGWLKWYVLATSWQHSQALSWHEGLISTLHLDHEIIWSCRVLQMLTYSVLSSHLVLFNDQRLVEAELCSANNLLWFTCVNGEVYSFLTALLTLCEITTIGGFLNRFFSVPELRRAYQCFSPCV